jgi:hypothetical protein
MKLALALLLASFLTLSAQSQLVKETIRIRDMKGTLHFVFDSLSSSRFKAEFVYGNNGTTIIASDSSFTSRFSEWELQQKTDVLVDSIVQKLVDGNEEDSAVVGASLKNIIFQFSPVWFKNILGKTDNKKEPTVVPNFTNLSVNDSLKAAIIPSCGLKIYAEKGSRRNVDSCRTGNNQNCFIPENVYVATIPVRRGKIYINDGFIYNFNFDIDTTGLPDSLKNLFQDHQAFSLRYNLRHNILAKAMLYNHPAVRLKRTHTNNRTKYPWSGFVFYINELLDYISPEGAPNTIFTTKDTILTFASCNGKLFDSVFIREKSLYSIINLDIFGDLVGFFGDNNPNGLIQTELKANFYGFRKPVGQKNPFRSRFTILNKGEIFFRFSKLDNKNRYLPVLTDTLRAPAVINDSAVKYVHGYRILEFQNIYGGIRFNIGEFEYRGGSFAITNEVSFLRAPLTDTIFRAQLEGSRVDTFLTPINYGKNNLLWVPGINLHIRAASFLDIDFHSRIFFIHPLTKKISTSKSEFDEFYGPNTFDPIITPKLLNLGVMVTINIDGAKTRRVIIRGENYVDWHSRGNNFWQAQVGYSADLNKFINLNNPANRKN